MPRGERYNGRDGGLNCHRVSMRLWSLHPKYLDAKGLVALWREGLLAQAVLAGKTRGYRQHPQLRRFSEAPTPERHIATYLRVVQAEGARRGYAFDARRIGSDVGTPGALEITEGQHEWAHLRSKLAARAPGWLAQFDATRIPEPHPLFRTVAGEIADWEADRPYAGK